MYFNVWLKEKSNIISSIETFTFKLCLSIYLQINHSPVESQSTLISVDLSLLKYKRGGGGVTTVRSSLLLVLLPTSQQQHCSRESVRTTECSNMPPKFVNFFLRIKNFFDSRFCYVPGPRFHP